MKPPPAAPLTTLAVTPEQGRMIKAHLGLDPDDTLDETHILEAFLCLWGTYLDAVTKEYESLT